MNQQRIIYVQKVSFIEIQSRLTHTTAPHIHNPDADDKILLYSVPTTLFIENILTTGSGKQLDRIA